MEVIVKELMEINVTSGPNRYQCTYSMGDVYMLGRIPWGDEVALLVEKEDRQDSASIIERAVSWAMDQETYG